MRTKRGQALAHWLRRSGEETPRTAPPPIGPSRARALSPTAPWSSMADHYRAVICEIVTGRRLEGCTRCQPPRHRPPRTAAEPPSPRPAPARRPAPRRATPTDKACEIEDFRDARAGRADLRDHLSARGGGTRQPPSRLGAEDRKQWEIAMSVRALRRHGALRPDADAARRRRRLRADQLLPDPPRGARGRDRSLPRSPRAGTKPRRSC
jgi:hypothetical protein